jgi:catechol 2,3-dioxygenase-like lactoylglutathione lyase family enzyme
MRLDHVTLRTADLERTKVFLEGLLGLKAGYRPPFGFPGFWLYAGDQPIVHLIPGDGTPAARNSEGIDHVAFRLDGYDEFRGKLDIEGIPYSTMDLAELGERRLFVRTPGGTVIELVFREVAKRPP